MKTYQKTLLGILATVVILIGSIQIYLSFFLDDQLKETAVERFHKATDDAYDLEVDDLDLQLFGRKLLISDITLTKKEDSKATDLRLTLDEFNISGISLFKLLFWDELTLKKIDLVDPKIYVTADGTSSSDEKTKWNKSSQRLSEPVLKVLGHLLISDLSITGLSINYNRADLSLDPYFSISNSDITFSNISIDSTSLNSDQVIPADDVAATFREIQFQTPDELYEITTDNMEFSTSNSMMTMSDIALKPKFNKQEFSEKVGHEIDRMDFKIKEIKFDNIDTKQLNKTEGLSVDLVHIDNADFDIFRDKRRPSAPKSYKPLPQEMIRSIPFPVNIDSIHFSGSNIRYTEHQPKAEKEGYIEFANLSATLTNLTNIEARWNDGKIPALHAKTDVMEHAQLDARFSFPIADGENRQEIKGTLQSMDMQPLNDALEPLAFVRIDQGQILGLDFEMNLTEKQAGGTLTLQYEDLKISLLNEEGSEENFGDKAKSLLANTFKINSDNKGEDPRVAKVDFERIEHKSVFNYWWKSLLSGLKESIGL